jgi:class 3 adenylate cyclase/pimeloyl-ACP methyl ester carboxylesterase
MELQTRYVTSADGTRIAMSTLGRGRPLILVYEIWLNSMESYWQVPAVRDNLERLAKRHTVVRFDHRGIGLSEREVADLSLDARVSDLAAVIDHLGAEEVDLLGYTSGGPVTIAYASRNPVQVRRLILLEALARTRDIQRPAHERAVWPLIESEWELFVRTLTLVAGGWTEIGLRMAQGNIDNITPQSFLAASRATGQYDVTNLLPNLRCPTLVMRWRGSPFVSLDVAKRMAASVPNARFVQFDQEQVLAFGGEASVQIIEQFLDEDESDPQDEQSLQGHAVILFADIADSTGLTERLGDSAFRDKARELDTSLRSLIRDTSGKPIEGKLLGDGVLAVFTSASAAIDCALRCGRAGDEAGLPLHLGIHAGDIIREENNVYGGAVNIASRISGLSAPGEVLVSDTVRSLARTSAGVDFEDRGEYELKGVADPQRLFVIRAREP